MPSPRRGLLTVRWCQAVDEAHMCFSPEADLVAGVVVGAIGVDALRHVQRPRDRAVASLPLVLGIHQLTEAVTWWGLEGRIPEAVGNAGLFLYLVIAFGVVPALVPIAVLLFERDPGRRRQMAPFAVAGAAVALILLRAVVAGPVEAEIAGRYIDYHVPSLTYGGELAAIYVIATAGPLLLSSNRRLVLFGTFNLIVVALLAWLLADGVISLWCVWAAVTSLIIAGHFRSQVPAAQPEKSISGLGG